MFFERVYDKSLAQASYMIGCQVTGEAIVIDAKRDVDTYLNLAKQNNLTISKVSETHIHADFLSGTRELAELTGAEIFLSNEGGVDWQYEFTHTALHDGDVLFVGNISLKVMHTAGHTPESISFLITDHPASDEPVIILTGDFVFVGDVGRPDLLEKAAGVAGSQTEGASQMYQSLQKFALLPDFIQLWPGHGAGSACGKSLGAVASSTVGYEKIRNWALEDSSKEEFVHDLLSGQPEPPTYFAMMKRLNKIERPLLTKVPLVPHLSDSQFVELYHKGSQIVDTRSKYQYAQNHIVGTYNIQANNSFVTWCGWVLKYDQPIILIAQDHQIDSLMRQLMRIGLDRVVGYISSIDAVELPKANYELVKKEDVESGIHDPNILIYDVRNENEYQKGHIEGAINIFVGTLEKNIDKINPSLEKIIYCQSGDRAALASSLLLKNGITNFKTYFGGMSEWSSQK